jgi:hypothetical protein
VDAAAAGGGGLGQRHHLSRCREDSIFAGLAPTRYRRISAEPAFPRLALSFQRVLRSGGCVNSSLDPLLRSLPVGEPQVLGRGVSMPDACATSVGKPDPGAPVVHRTILRGSALASNVGGVNADRFPLIKGASANRSRIHGKTTVCVSSSIRREKHCLGFELGHSRQITRNPKFDHPSSARSGDLRRRARGSGSWRAVWDDFRNWLISAA